MKVTRSQLKQLIKEELTVLSEDTDSVYQAASADNMSTPEFREKLDASAQMGALITRLNKVWPRSEQRLMHDIVEITTYYLSGNMQAVDEAIERKRRSMQHTHK